MGRAVETADVCLILEGTYPYVRGGVSSWVHSLISGLPEITFSLLHLSSKRSIDQPKRYELPDNVISFAEAFIHESLDERSPNKRKTKKSEDNVWNLIENYHEADAMERCRMSRELLSKVSDPRTAELSVHDAFHSLEAWELVLKRYRERAPDSSFIDYFWTWRAVHAPLFQTMIAEIPPAHIYHTVSTGYAGLLRVLAKLRHKKPLLLTEHGVYVRERAIDIAQAEWIYEEPVRLKVARAKANPLKEMWINFFVTLGEMTYQEADEIITLFEGNRLLQHDLGADPSKTSIVVNGVNIDKYAAMRATRDEFKDRPLRVGFVGRVVPIKDVKTLVRACSLVAQEMPLVEFWIVGPVDEDEEYAQECKQLAEGLNIEKLEFLGTQDVTNIYPKIDVMVLTSISEGQPLTIIEAGCAGVPTVATEVGACRELCEGRTDEDRLLGPSGLITGVGNANQTAHAILKILGNERLRKKMSKAAVVRAERYYRQSEVLNSYRSLYQRYL